MSPPWADDVDSPFFAYTSRLRLMDSDYADGPGPSTVESSSSYWRIPWSSRSKRVEASPCVQPNGLSLLSLPFV